MNPRKIILNPLFYTALCFISTPWIQASAQTIKCLPLMKTSLQGSPITKDKLKVTRTTRTDFLTEGSQHLYLYDSSGENRVEISPFPKIKGTELYPPADIDYVLSPDGLLIAYFRKSNGDHALLIRKGEHTVIRNIQITLGSPSRIKTNLETLNLLDNGRVQYKPKESLRNPRTSPQFLQQNWKSIQSFTELENLASELKSTIEYHALPSLALEGSYYRPVQENQNQDAIRVKLWLGNTEVALQEIISFLYENRTSNESSLALQNLSRRTNRGDYLIVTAHITVKYKQGPNVGQVRTTYDILNALVLYSQGHDVNIEVLRISPTFEPN